MNNVSLCGAGGRAEQHGNKINQKGERDREGETNLRAQRSFAQLTSCSPVSPVLTISSWLELMASAAGLDGEVRGTKVALRECSRLIGVAQPLAGAWLQAIPGPNQFRLRSTLYEVRDRAAVARPADPHGVGSQRDP